MITKSTHQPTPQDRKAAYDWNKRGYAHLNLPPCNIFTKQFNSSFHKEFSNDRV